MDPQSPSSVTFEANLQEIIKMLETQRCLYREAVSFCKCHEDDSNLAAIKKQILCYDGKLEVLYRKCFKSPEHRSKLNHSGRIYKTKHSIEEEEFDDPLGKFSELFSGCF